ncbi:MAG: PAS domain-containing protein [Microscillaceae bacterium]|nr:PAS domain-containing protein [Microscillaceae bacterium]MDW8459626.1 PAS domain-containing protein [Cytophagales bacterium]
MEKQSKVKNIAQDDKKTTNKLEKTSTTPLKSIKNYWNIRTITGKIVWLTFSFLSILIITNSLTLYQNQRTTSLNQYVEEVRSKIPALSNALVSSLNRSISLQKSYWMTQDKKYLRDRDFLWEAIISKQSKELLSLKDKVLEKENKARLDSIQKLLPKLQKKQQSLDKDFERQVSYRKFYIKQDTLAKQTLRAYIEQEAKLQTTFNELLENKDAEFKELRQILIRLSSSSNKLLEDELKRVNKELNQLSTFIVIATIFALLIIISLTYSLTRKFQESIAQPAFMLNQLADGELIRVAKVPDNEFADIVKSANTLSKRLRRTSLFALEIGEGRFDTPFEPVSQQDMLGNALLQMSQKLQKSSEKDFIRKWTTEGLSKFVIMLRENKENLKLWAETIIWQMTKYVEAQNGCFYILNEDNPQEPYLELFAGYGLNDKNLKREKIKIHQRFAEGLVGQCFKEARTLIFTDIPNDYVQISSASGKAKPKFLLIVPLKLNEKVEGVVELASIKPMPPYQIEFIERLAENIAANLLTIKANDKTQKLLLETQKQADMLKTQEEEMRQNYEELQASQEETKYKSLQLEKLLQEAQQKELEILHVKAKIEKAKQNFEQMTDAVPGVIFQYKKKKGEKAEFLYVSSGTKEIFGLEPQELLKDSDNFFKIIHPDFLQDLAESFRKSIKTRTIWEWQGKIIQPDGTEKWVSSTARPQVSEDQAVIYSGMFSDITHLKKTEEVLEKTLITSQEKTAQLAEQEIIAKQSTEAMLQTQEMLQKKTYSFEQQQDILNAILSSIEESILVINREYKIILLNEILKKQYENTSYRIDIGSNILETLGDLAEEWKGYYDRGLSGESFSFIKENPLSPNQRRRYFINPVKQKNKIIGVSVISKELDNNFQVVNNT